MHVQLLGCSHHNAPVAIRERFSFGPEQIRHSVHGLRKRFPQLEIVLLSTCNRVELYTATQRDEAPPCAEIAEALAAEQQVNPQDVMEHLYGLHGRDAIRHLFLVASSLDSMVVGEAQISAQVKHAYQTATEQEATGPVTHAVFQRASKVARRVATETAIHKRRVSIPSVAIADFARQVFERFDDKVTLVIGAGEMAEETLRYLQDFGATDITIINRTLQTAVSLAQAARRSSASLGRAVRSPGRRGSGGQHDWCESSHRHGGGLRASSPHANGRPILILDLGRASRLRRSDRPFPRCVLVLGRRLAGRVRAECHSNASENYPRPSGSSTLKRIDSCSMSTTALRSQLWHSWWTAYVAFQGR